MNDDGYDPGDPKAAGYIDQLTDRADNHREATH